MVQNIPSTEPRRTFGELLDHVREGESFAITQNGRIVARLVPPEERRPPMALEDALRALRAIRPVRPLDRSEIRGMIEDGRRF